MYVYFCTRIYTGATNCHIYIIYIYKEPSLSSFTLHYTMANVFYWKRRTATEPTTIAMFWIMKMTSLQSWIARNISSRLFQQAGGKNYTCYFRADSKTYLLLPEACFEWFFTPDIVDSIFFRNRTKKNLMEKYFWYKRLTKILI